MIDLLIKAAFAVPMTGPGDVIEDAAIAVRDGRIEFVGRAADLPTDSAASIVDLGQHILMPGLINAHGHAAMTLLRGLADDADLQTWLREHIWPIEGQFVDASFVRVGAQLAIAEMLRTGTTFFSDMYFFPEETADAAVAAGMRCQIAFPVADFAGRWAASASECLSRGLELFDRYRDEPLVQVAFGPHAVYTVDDVHLRKILTYASELDAPVHIHIQENAAEIDECLATRGERPIATLKRLGLLSPSLQVVHATILSDEDIRDLAEAGASVVHCPHSNLKLGSGIARINDLRTAGVNVAIGTDGAASNNALDMFAETRQASLLSRIGAEDSHQESSNGAEGSSQKSSSSASMSAYDALHMATLGGARALGLDEFTGSLEAGKWADIIAVNTAVPGMTPMFDPISQLVHSTAGRFVTDVWVAGQRCLRAGALTTLHAGKLSDDAKHWQMLIKEADNR